MEVRTDERSLSEFRVFAVKRGRVRGSSRKMWTTDRSQVSLSPNLSVSADCVVRVGSEAKLPRLGRCWYALTPSEMWSPRIADGVIG